MKGRVYDNMKNAKIKCEKCGGIGRAFNVRERKIMSDHFYEFFLQCEDCGNIFIRTFSVFGFNE